MKTHRISLLLSLFLLFCLPAGAFALELFSSSKIPRHTLKVDGLERSYFVYRPHGHQRKAELPLVIVLHGGGPADGEKAAKNFGFNELARRHGFIAVYPNGVDSYWRDGRGYTHRGDNDAAVDDVAFLSALIDHFVLHQGADPRRVYVTGTSNGGMMTLRLGCEIAPKLAAIAPVISSIPKNIYHDCRPETDLPVLIMNGTEDPLMPWDGGHVRFFRKKMGEVVSTRETVMFWIKHNRCNPRGKTIRLPDRDRNDQSTVEVSRFSNGRTGVDVVLYKIVGGGHNLPGSDARERKRVTGRKNNDINGAREIWKFFQDYSR
jgi:polyhydroxybutyrate depolymerase